MIPSPTLTPLRTHKLRSFRPLSVGGDIYSPVSSTSAMASEDVLLQPPPTLLPTSKWRRTYSAHYPVTGYGPNILPSPLTVFLSPPLLLMRWLQENFVSTFHAAKIDIMQISTGSGFVIDLIEVVYIILVR